jgi:hypothetical protein
MDGSILKGLAINQNKAENVTEKANKRIMYEV